MYLVWTEEKINKFKNMYPTASWEELEKEFKINKSSLLHKAKDLKVKRQNGLDSKFRNHFSEEEKQYIIENYKKLSAKEIANKLGRTEQAIFAFWSNNKISSDALWTEKDEELFKEVYPKYTNEYLVKHYFPKRTVMALINEAQKLKITKMGGKGLRQYNKEDITDMYIETISKLGYIPSFDKIKDLHLPSTKTINRYFNMTYPEFIKSLNLEGVEYHGQQFGEERVASDGTKCHSYCEWAITEWMIKNNIKYDKEVYYYTVMPREECGLKRFDWKVGNYYIEFFGIMDKEFYRQRVCRKIFLCHKYKVNLIDLYYKDFPKTLGDIYNYLDNHLSFLKQV